jgi:hypothetical protein
MKTVYDQTGKSVYFTEQWTSGNGNFSDDFCFHIREVMFGSMQNRGKIALVWNVASNENWEPHTPGGGCEQCMGAVTINSGSKAITRNVSYYTAAQFSKITRKGSVLLHSTANANDLHHLAFSNPDGSVSLVIFNQGERKTIEIQWKGKYCPYTLEKNTVASLIWHPETVTENNPDKIPDTETLSIFPNPTSGLLTVSCYSKENRMYGLYSLTGAPMRSGNLNQMQNEINLADMQSGIYFLKIQSDNNTHCAKVIKI